MLLILLSLQNVSEYKRELERVNREIQQVERSLRELSRKERNYLKEISYLDEKIDLYSRKLHVLKNQEKELRKEIEVLEKQIEETRNQIEEMRKKLTRGAVLMYHLPRRNIWQLLLETGSFFDSYQREVLLTSILSHYRSLVKSLRQKQEELSMLKSRRSIRLAQLRRTEKQVQTTLASLNSSRRKKENLIRKIRANRRIKRNYLRELEASRRRLLSIIESLSRGRKSRKPISILLPVDGKIVTPFGRVRDRLYGTVIENKGVDIKAPYGSPVKAASNGKVVYVGWVEGYGNIVIVDGGGFYTVYSQLSEILVNKGDRVSKGQVIGRVGSRPLHFELRIGRKAVNPVDYFE